MTSECLLVPTDFSPDADGALWHAITLGIPLHAHLVLLHVRDDEKLNPWSYSGGAEAATRVSLQNLLQLVKEAGLTGEIALVNGVPWQEIIDMARTCTATLIVMGTHGRTGLRRLLLGSVAEQVVRHTSCPVLVCRHPESMPQEGAL
jgi:nucleotide-binding universal stress UspA family protein